MVAQDVAPLRTVVIAQQSLIAKALRSLLSAHAAVDVVGDAKRLTEAEITRLRPKLILFDLDNASDVFEQTIALVQAANQDIRVCVISSYANPELMQRTMTAGADGFLLKDMAISELEIALRTIASDGFYVDPRVAGKMLQRRYDPTSPSALIAELSARETEILKLLSAGLANKEIGAKLTLSEKTIKNYVSRILAKLNVCARTQAAVFAIKAGMV